MCPQFIDCALNPATISKVMDEATERYLNPLTSPSFTDRAETGSENTLGGLTTYQTSQRLQTVSESLEARATNLVQLFSKGTGG